MVRTDSLLRIEDLTFTYPDQPRPAIAEVSLTVERGELVVLCGPSGCGKTTLLRSLKPMLAPCGTIRGRLLWEGVPMGGLTQREQARRIGFVSQAPGDQVVTDKVWHELAFGLESLGYETPVIRRRVAEMAAFFGMEDWFRRDTASLSGGQQQLLNLAAAMVTEPDLLLLDEPTGQLDPIAAADFLALLGRINRELGTTVLLAEHRLEEALPLAHRAVVLDGGRVLCQGAPGAVGEALRASGHRMFAAMPAAMRVWAGSGDASPCPVTVGEGRSWLARRARRVPLRPLPPEAAHPHGEAAGELAGVWFRYGPQGGDVLRGLDLTVHRGELLALLGGNGAGKTTALRLLASLERPDRGEVRLHASVGLLPQDPRALFTKNTVGEELAAGGDDGAMAALCGLTELLDRHPYDLSGGEQQRLALGRVLLTGADLLLLDEPTKGLDSAAKETLGRVLETVLARGAAVLLVSHDVEFCARYAHRCALLFDGAVAAEGTPRAFFSGNRFYTTAANRIARDWAPQAVTVEDAAALCGGDAEPPEAEPAAPTPASQKTREKEPTLPRWRRRVAGFAAAAAAVLLLRAASVTDLTALVRENGPMGLSGEQGRLLLALGAVLAVLCAAAGRGRAAPELRRRPFTRRSALILLGTAALTAVTAAAGFAVLGTRRYLFLALLVLLEGTVPFLLAFENRRPPAREIAVTAVLCALGVAGRAAFFMLPQCKPVLALTILAGVSLGGETGFLVGAVTMLVSNLLYGQGPWTPWQMFAMGLCGALAGAVFARRRPGRLALCFFGAVCAIVIYGGIMNPASALLWAEPISWRLLAACYISGFPMDCVHAAATWAFLWLGAEPMLEKLERVKSKYGVGQQAGKGR